MKHKFTLPAILFITMSANILAQNNFLTVSELIVEYNNLGLSSGTTASGTYTVRGYVTLWQNGYPQYQNASFYIDDSGNGSTTLLQCFRLTGTTTTDQRKLVVGDYVEIQNAQLANYYGNAELKNGSFTIISDALPAEYKGETTIANFLAQADLKNIYQLTGIVSGLTEGNSMTYGNLTLTDETGSVYVYGILDANGQSGNFISLNIANGDTLTIQGVYSFHNSQVEIKDAQYISHRKHKEEPAQFMGAVSIAEFLAAADTKNIYELTGAVYSIYDSGKGVILIADESGQINVDGVLTADSVADAFSTLDVAQDDTITINVIYNENGGVRNAVFVNRSKYVAPPLVCQCGDNVYYTIDSDTETLTIYGSGDMWDRTEPITQYACSISSPIQSIVIEEGVTSIGNYAFDRYNAYCFDALQSITLPTTLLRIGVSAFRGCNNLSSISIPSSLQRIEEQAFTACNISAVNIPANVNYIAMEAFSGCPLTEINVVTENRTFSSLEGVLFDKEQKKLFLYPVNKSNDVYAIPNTVEWINHEAFYGNKNIISISMSNNVKGIGLYAFYGCEKLIAINLSNNLEFIGTECFINTALFLDEREWDSNGLYVNNCLIHAGSKEIYEPNDPVVPDNPIVPDSPQDENSAPKRTWMEQQDTTYMIKDGTRLIATYAAEPLGIGGDAIKKLTIPSSIEYINPEGLVIESLTEIVWNAKYCHDFEITVPVVINKDSSLNYNPFYSIDAAFAKPSNVKKISFAKDVEYIPAGLCSVMPNLEEVYNYNPEPIAVSENMFDGVGYTCILYVPKGSKEKYEAAPVWRNFYRIREMEGTDGIEDIRYNGVVPSKILNNGQIYILRGTKTYSVQGQEVK